MTTYPFVGNVVVSGTNGSPPQITVDDPSDTVRQYQVATNGSSRWSFGADPSSESGGNVGSNLFLARYNDSGNYVDTVLDINRSSGNTNFYHSVYGGSNANSGGKLQWGSQSGWLQSLILYTESQTRFQSIDVEAGFGGLFATRTSDSSNDGTDGTHGISVYGINNNSHHLQIVHGAYIEARSITDDTAGGTDAVAPTLGIEIGLVRTGSDSPAINPFAMLTDTKFTVAYWATSGRGDVTSSHNVSAWAGVYKGAIPDVSQPPTTYFRSGLVFDYQSLDPSGQLSAVHLPSNYNLRWTASYTTEGQSPELYDPLVIDGSTFTTGTWSNRDGYTFSLVNAAAGGGDTALGSALGVHNYYQVVSGTPQQRVHTRAVKMSNARSSYVIASTNDAVSWVDVSLNARANNCWAPGQDSLLANGDPNFRWANTYTQVVTLGDGVRILSGSLGPNGYVIGSPGDMYLCTTGGTGATLWIKETGTASSTGWINK